MKKVKNEAKQIGLHAVGPLVTSLNINIPSVDF